MARTNIQIFACPACSKLYKRKVAVWIDFQNPRPPPSPHSDTPRVCVCGRSFLLSESTVIATLSPSDRPGSRSASKGLITEWNIDSLDIPSFLRKKATTDEAEQPIDRAPRKSPLNPEFSLFKKLKAGLTFLFSLRRPPRKKSAIVKDVLWQMEELALPEKIARSSIQDLRVIR